MYVRRARTVNAGSARIERTTAARRCFRVRSRRLYGRHVKRSANVRANRVHPRDRGPDAAAKPRAAGATAARPRRRIDVAFLALLGCFLLSGFAALLYETVWTREFAFVF